MPLIRSEGSGDVDLGFYNGVAEQSLRFNDDDAAALTITPSSAGNRKMWTTSMWVKRTETGDANYLWSSYGANDGIAAIYFNTDDKIHSYYDTSGANPYGAVGNRLFRDTTNWYHIVWAVDAANTIHKIWVNNELISTDTSMYPPNYSYNMNNTAAHKFGDPAWGASSDDFDGYLAHFVHLDGQYLEPDSFGETKNGVWIPIDTSGLTFGTNGFQLEFKQTGTGTASASTIGADTSGNDNHLTSTNLVASDSNLPDCPENNFCTLNPLDIGGHSPATNAVMTLAEGNLHVTHNNTGQWQGHRGTFPVSSGKWYYEVQMTTRPTGTTENYGIGFFKADKYNQMYYTLAGNLAFGMQGNTATTYKDTATTGYGTAADADGETYMVAVDFDNSKIWFGLEGSWMASGDPAAGSNPSISSFDAGTYVPLISSYAYAGSAMGVWIYNFGQEGTFAGTKTAGDNADDNGHGNFLYDVPAGFLAMCSSNLAEPTIGPNSTTQADDHFNAVIYSGDGNSQAITGVGFQSDLLWIKKRSGADNHVLFDSTRGPASGAKHRLHSNTTAIESDGGVTVIGSDGFTVDGAYGSSGENNHTYVAWNWKANGGTTSSNTEGSTTSTVQANTTAGFSILKYAGNSSSKTVGHGLDSAPEMVIVKSLTDTERWCVFHTETSNAYLYLNEDYLPETANADERFGNSTSVVVPSSTLVTLGANSSDVNENGDDYIMYCFHSVAGYSKFGGYAGIGGTEGSYVYTGFKPKWIMVKSISGAVDNWAIYDSARDTFNVRDSYIYADANSGEATYSTAIVDFLSNGFKWRGAVNFGNNSSRTYAYAAFAEAPFKYANAG